MNKILKLLIGCTIQVFVDDIITKFKNLGNHTRHLEETLELLRKYKMKLNPKKCVFEVSS